MWSFENASEDKFFHSEIRRFHQTEQMKREISKRKYKVYLECDKDEGLLHQSCVNLEEQSHIKYKTHVFMPVHTQTQLHISPDCV